MRNIIGFFRDPLLVIGISLIALIVSGLSGWYTYKTAEYTREANEISSMQAVIADQQKEIMQQQTDILDRQTEIQEQGLEFEKDKHRTDTAKEYRDKINDLYDKINGSNEMLTNIHNKIKNGEKILDQSNLDRYVSEFENIGALFCDNKLKIADLRTILKSDLQFVCGNAQIFNYYQNTKSGVSGMCVKLFPGSTVMAKYANDNKCSILKK